MADSRQDLARGAVFAVQARSCVTEYSLLLCLLFERSFQANKALPWPSVCTSQFQGVFRVLRRAWLVSWTGVPQSSSLCRLHHLRLQVHHVTPSILVCCVGPVVLFLATPCLNHSVHLAELVCSFLLEFCILWL